MSPRSPLLSSAQGRKTSSRLLVAPTARLKGETWREQIRRSVSETPLKPWRQS